MILHSTLRKTELIRQIRARKIALGGNVKLKIYGTLQCTSGKRIKMENRVFFRSENEAKTHGYRPCGHCMPEKYKEWKNGFN
ncbi:MAG: metal-binding protein [Bacteroidia bacterium]|nr:metal-binding protein [Bacteroidia bacterium]